MDIKTIRKDIDKVNDELIDSFTRRMDLVRDVVEYKIENGIKVLDRERERQILKAIKEKVDERYRTYTEEFLENVMSLSRKMQHDIIESNSQDSIDTIEQKANLPSVAYLGIPGSFSEQSVIEYFGDKVNPVGVSSFSDIIIGVEVGTYQMAMLPVENSSTGSVNQVVDLLVNGKVHIIGEHVVKVRHFLLAQKGCDLREVKKVVSHPQALEQCKEYLDSNGLFPVSFESTAGAAKHVANSNEVNIGAIASKRAAQIYDLDVVAEDIQTNDTNYTRFILVSKENKEIEDADKISIICTIDHKPGSLHHLLDIFSRNEINLLQLFSRPIHNMPWKYRFHLDFAGNINDNNVQKALDKARDYCITLKILGNYKGWDEDE
jgi:chorismate mutase/prephenate dehydratase